MKRPNRTWEWALAGVFVLLLAAFYAEAFVLLAPFAGRDLAALSVLWVAGAGWWGGRWVGLAAGALNLPLHAVLFTLLGLGGALTEAGVLMGFGAGYLIGWLREHLEVHLAQLQALAFLGRAARLGLETESESALVEAAARAAIEEAGYLAVAIDLPGEGLAQRFGQALPPGVPAPEFLGELARRSGGRAVWRNGVNLWPPRRPRAAAAINTGDLGLLVVYSHRRRAFGEVELDLLADVLRVVRTGVFRIRLERERNLLARAVEQSPEGVMITDVEGKIHYVNAAFEAQTGYRREEVIGKNPRFLKSGHHNPAFYRRLWQTLLRGEVFEGVFVNRTKAGELVYEAKQIAPVRDASGRITHFVSTGRNVSEEVRLRQELLRQATNDPLTGLLNRRAFIHRVSQQLRSRGVDRGVLIVIDLDHFKDVNDEHGHPVGDRVLEAVAERLVASVRGRDLVGRLGGDEFVIWLPGAGPEGGERVVQAIMNALKAPVVLDGVRFEIGASFGLAVYPDDGTDFDALLHKADTAMYQAKAQGEGWRFFDPGLDEKKQAQKKILLGLRQAISREELFLAYQPIRALASGEAVGVEALVRWRDPEAGVRLPGAFLPLAENTGLVVELDRYVLQHALQEMASWDGGDALGLWVNVSPKTIAGGNFVADLEGWLQGSGFLPERLTLEITERLWSRRKNVKSRFFELKELGVRLAIDDFGTGYASIAELGELPFDALKIDVRFVEGVDRKPREEAVVEAVAILARALGLELVAEGVERESQRQRLIELGLELGQGERLGPPGPLSALNREVGPTASNGGTRGTHRQMGDTLSRDESETDRTDA